MEIAIGFVMAVMISLTMYIGKLQKGDEFQPSKLVRTVVVGLILGGIAQWKGFTITQENWDTYLATYAGVIGAADQGLKVAWRAVFPAEDE